MSKHYAEPAAYEAKLEKVMARLGVEKFNYNWDRFSCWVEFFYKGQLYRFEHSVDNAKQHGVDIRYGSDIFAQVVLSLEDLARMVERGIYDLSTWVAGMKLLPQAADIPKCFITLGFGYIPDAGQLKDRFKALAKVAHPDAGGNNEHFMAIKAAYDEATVYLNGEG